MVPRTAQLDLVVYVSHARMRPGAKGVVQLCRPCIFSPLSVCEGPLPEIVTARPSRVSWSSKLRSLT